jgi:hypothetical protein
VSRRGEDRGRAEASTGAWAAAAVVLALGGLGFGVVAQVRTSDLEDRVDRLEITLAQKARTPASTTTVVDNTPTTLGRQPESPDEARADVLHAFDVAYDGAKPIEERLSFVDDTSGVAAAITSTASGPFAEQAARSRVRVDDVTFTSAVEATVRYVVVSGGVAQLDDRVGAARNVGGTWKVTRDTICTDLVAAGANCQA